MKAADESPLIDLYDILEVPRNAQKRVLRMRIARLYIEAQDNLDHRNFRRRFYYQELFETYLPQAHHLLLNDERRAEYDKQLAQRQIAEVKGRVAGPSNREVQEVESLRALLPTQEELQEELQGDLVESLEGDAQAQQRAAEVIKNRPPRPPAPQWARMDADRVKNRRAEKRLELIRQELVATGRRYALIGLATTTLIGIFFIIIINEWFFAQEAPLFVLLLAFVLTGVLAFLTARHFSQHARQRIIAQLSTMPYEELLRRCGTA